MTSNLSRSARFGLEFAVGESLADEDITDEQIAYVHGSGVLLAGCINIYLLSANLGDYVFLVNVQRIRGGWLVWHAVNVVFCIAATILCCYWRLGRG